MHGKLEGAVEDEHSSCGAGNSCGGGCGCGCGGARTGGGASGSAMSRALLMKLTTEQQLWDVLPPAYRALVDESAELMHSGDTVHAGTYIQYCAAAHASRHCALSAAATF